MFYIIHDKNTGVVTRTITMPYYMPDVIKLGLNESMLESDVAVDDTKNRISNGVIVARVDLAPNDISKWDGDIGEWVVDGALLATRKANDQAIMWERIKEKRLLETTSGVYVSSVDKIFHTDSLSAIQYSSVAGMIALNNYEPIEWKVMDNTWVVLTESLFKELQIAISKNTNNAYKVAEQHKAAMENWEEPLKYDYSEGWY